MFRTVHTSGGGARASRATPPCRKHQHTAEERAIPTRRRSIRFNLSGPAHHVVAAQLFNKPAVPKPGVCSACVRLRRVRDQRPLLPASFPHGVRGGEGGTKAAQDHRRPFPAPAANTPLVSIIPGAIHHWNGMIQTTTTQTSSPLLPVRRRNGEHDTAWALFGPPRQGQFR